MGSLGATIIQVQAKLRVMIISSGRRFIFVHIPKTGGTALSLALEERAMADDILIGDTPKAVKRRARVKKLKANGRLWKHSRLSDIEGLVAQEDFEKFFVFTIVRNPWDRSVSYYHWLQRQNWDHPAVKLAKSADFSAFINHPQTQAGLSVPYRASTSDSAGADRADLNVRLEHLDADLAPFWTHLGFDLSPIERANASKRDRDYRLYYNDADAALIARLSAEDIDRFSYSFDPQ